MRTRAASGAPLMKQGVPNFFRSSRQTSETDCGDEVFTEEAHVVRHKPCCTSGTVLALLCLLCLGVAILVAVLAALIFGRANKHFMEDGDFLYCLPCESRILNYTTIQNLADQGLTEHTRRIKGEDVKICCGKEPFDFVDMYVADEKSQEKSQLANDQEEERFLPFPSEDQHVTNRSRSSAHPPVAAHLVMDKKHHTEPGPDGLFHVHSWSHRGGQKGVLKQHIKYRKGRLLVGRPGLYYVYSQIHFLERPRQQSTSYSSNSIAHYLFKYNRNLPNGGERRLLQNARSRCNDSSSYLEYSSYLGAVFSLQAGDQLLVKVNNWTAVYPEGTSTYFGLYLLHADI